MFTKKKLGQMLAPLFLGVSMLMPSNTNAMTLDLFSQKSTQEQRDMVIGFVDKLTTNIAKTNPTLAQEIKDYFEVAPPGALNPVGMVKFFDMLGDEEGLAKAGQEDLSKVKFEAIVIVLMHREFPQPVTVAKTPTTQPTTQPTAVSQVPTTQPTTQP